MPIIFACIYTLTVCIYTSKYTYIIKNSYYDNNTNNIKNMAIITIIKT